MSYRSIKRVLGESSLERKIRILFGICLLLLIAGSFLWVSKITENLIRENTRDRASDLLKIHLLKKHFNNTKFNEDDPKRDELVKSIPQQFVIEDYDAKVLVLDDTIKWFGLVTESALDTTPKKAAEVATGAERDLLLALEGEWNEYRFLRDAAASENQPLNGDTANRTTPKFEERTVFRDSFIENNQYVYFEPVEFRAGCRQCHPPVPPAEWDDEAVSEFFQSDPESQVPTHFISITLQYQDAKEAINRSRAILLAVAIVTAFLSIVALYLIVRYVIVKPLRILRDVAEAVNEGDREERSELRTGDEFEELSMSFDRMIRTMVDKEEELQQKNLALNEKVDEQALLNLRLNELNKVKSEFLANMSHELRTPLNSIIGFSEILESAELESQLCRYAGNIRKSGRLLLELINDILDLAKLEAGRMEVKPQEFSIRSMTEELCDLVRHLALDKNIALLTEVPENLPPVFQDRIKIGQILTNLLSNAIKFTPEGGRIRVSADHVEDELVLKVHDTGVGISEDEIEIIFEKFRQGPAAIGGDQLTREVTGTGLGLSIVKELSILLGGDIFLESEVGKGSIFTVMVPWNFRQQPRADLEIDRQIGELTKSQSQKVDFARASESPRLPRSS